MKEVAYPEKRTFYVAYSDDGKIIHYGVTEPNQVTTTGQPQFETFLKIIDCERKLKTDLGVTDEQLKEQPIDSKIIEPIDEQIIKR